MERAPPESGALTGARVASTMQMLPYTLLSFLLLSFSMRDSGTCSSRGA